MNYLWVVDWIHNGDWFEFPFTTYGQAKRFAEKFDYLTDIEKKHRDYYAILLAPMTETGGPDYNNAIEIKVYIKR